MSSRSARRWKSRSPGVEGAACTGPRIGANGRRSSGRRPGDRRSHSAAPTPTTHDSRPPRSRKPTFLTRSPTAPSVSRTRATSASVSPTATTRNTAARDSGASTLCASIGTRSHGPCDMAEIVMFLGVTYVIVGSCIKDDSCIEVCPVDCIHPKPGAPDFETAEQLYIDPAICIDCDACVEACPVDAIFADHEVPQKFDYALELNAEFFAEQSTAERTAA